MVALYERACRLLGVQLDAGPVIVACSGGADSAASLLLAREIAPKAKLLVCYVDHGLRPPKSIERDVTAVRAQARAAKAKVVVRKLGPLQPARESPEERARNARYRELESVARSAGAAVVLTGHQRDDLVETSLLALARGSGIDGVAAMRPSRALCDGVMLARPLLWATKMQCREFVRSRRVPFSEDETNADVRVPRNAVRTLLAALETVLPQSNRGIARSAALLADDRELLHGMSVAAWSQARIENSLELSVAPLRRLPIALLRRVIRQAVEASGAGLRNFSFEHCDAIARAIKQGRGGRYHAGATTVVLSSGKFVVETGAQGGSVFTPVTVDLTKLPASYSTPAGTATFFLHKHGKRERRDAASPAQFLDAAGLLGNGPVELRGPRKGDTCVPSGHRRPVSLARFLGKAGVSLSRRSNVALLCAGGRIAAVLGRRVMEPYVPKSRSPVLEVGWRAADI